MSTNYLYEAGSGIITVGDKEFEEMLARERPYVMWLARRAGLNPDQAEDVAQAVLISAWTKRDYFSPQRASLRTWLHRTASNAIVDYQRSQSRHSRVEVGLPEEASFIEAPATPDSDPETAALLRSDVALACNVIDRIRQRIPSYAEVLELSLVEDLTPQEIAERLGISKENAGARLFRARKLMRKYATELRQAINREQA